MIEVVVVEKNWILVVVQNLLFRKMLLKQFIKLVQLSRNECIRCVRAPDHALDYFWWMGDLTLRFLGENDEDPSRNMRKHAFTERCACGRALGVHLQRASSRRCTSGARRPGQDNGNVVPCPGAWGQSCRGPMRPFEGVLLLFSLTFQLEQTWLYRNLDFLNGLKLVFVSFWFFGK